MIDARGSASRALGVEPRGRGVAITRNSSRRGRSRSDQTCDLIEDFPNKWGKPQPRGHPTMDLPCRTGPKPQTSIEGSQSQLTENSSPELWGRLMHLAITEHNVVEGISSVSLQSSRAIFFRDLRKTVVPWTSLAPAEKRLEPVHIHGVHDTSIHLCMPTDRAGVHSRKPNGGSCAQLVVALVVQPRSNSLDRWS